MRFLARQMGFELRGEWGFTVQNATSEGLGAQLKSNAGVKNGIVDRVAAKFPRHGIYRMHGAGRGQGGNIGSTWRNKDGQLMRAQPSSKGKMATGNRRRADWLGPTLDKYNKLIADRAAAHVATIGQQLTLEGIPETKKRI